MHEARALLGGRLYGLAARGAQALIASDATAGRLLARLGPSAWRDVQGERLGTVYEALSTLRISATSGGALFAEASTARLRSGSHYTPRALADEVAHRTLAPLAAAAQVAELRVCDPAVGGGAFLLGACRALAALSGGGPDALRDIAETCVRGVDRDPFAVDVAREAIWIETGARLAPRALLVGDALIDESLGWPAAFPDVFGRPGKSGFDAIVGNPPWISYAGRAAQPLEPARRRLLADRFRAFAGFRNLQGLFIERCTALLAPGGRMGLLVPSSMSEQAGYAPSRAAHDGACACDEDLPDFGDSFEGVVQPCMALISTRRDAPITATAQAWPVARPDLDDCARAILRKLDRAPLPPHLFGERGLQSSGSDVLHLAAAPDAHHAVPIRAGSDIQAFCRREPSRHASGQWFGKRLRDAQQFADVKLLIRQTARVPTACLSDGAAFRNSILAGFEDATHPAAAMVAYLNSSPLRFVHYARNRDARQGLPQVKIGHLRALPDLPNQDLTAALQLIGAAISETNLGLGPDDRASIDRLVADAFGLGEAERAHVAAWAAAVR
jgi:hypothetical protein